MAALGAALAMPAQAQQVCGASKVVFELA